MNVRVVALVAGVFFIFLATFIQGILPAIVPESLQTRVSKVVRTDLGELKWMIADATDYTPQQARGRNAYIREGCWYCHSQFVRPVTGESRRWGPVSQSGEYAFDQPHLFSTRRIGPDLARVGLKYSDGWHLAHFWNPRMITPDSIMPRFSWLFDQAPERVKIVTDAAGRRTLEKTAASEALFNFTSPERVRLTPNAEGLLFVRKKGEYPVIFTPNKEFAGDSVQLISSTGELDALIAYVQKLGTNRGKWRDLFEPQQLDATDISIPRSEEWIEYGKNVYRRRCLGCHGANGDGNGPAATFLDVRPRNFKIAVFKFRTTPTGSLPTDGDLIRTITRGVRGTAMPTFHMVPMKDRLAVVQYIKYQLAVDRTDPDEPFLYFVEEPPLRPFYIGAPPEPSPELVEEGRAIWGQAKCWECHGDKGKGDGAKARTLKDDFGFSIPPANLTTGLFKSGSTVKDIFRTITTGLNGTPMPTYVKSFTEDQRWALSYYILSLSAYTDPLSGKPLSISREDRRALNDPELRAPSVRLAYGGRNQPRKTTGASKFAGDAWASRHGIENAEDITSKQVRK
ncbi:MAG: cbb3-type cytochrome c oxidase subunit II [Rhodospirillales bacterium]|nr:cbb3-type cytochrome c oxidase subunit II [Rhodospirillales bacterium]